MKDNNVLNPLSHMVYTRIGKAIAEKPLEIRKLLARYRIIVAHGNENQTLTDAVLYALHLGDKGFQHELSLILSDAHEDEFIGAIAGAVGAAANAVNSGQQRKAMKEQARSQTLSSILAYKAQQDQNRVEQLKLQDGRKKPGDKQKSVIRIVTITGGVIIMLFIVMMVYQKQKQSSNTVTKTKVN